MESYRVYIVDIIFSLKYPISWPIQLRRFGNISDFFAAPLLDWNVFSSASLLLVGVDLWHFGEIRELCFRYIEWAIWNRKNLGCKPFDSAVNYEPALSRNNCLCLDSWCCFAKLCAILSFARTKNHIWIADHRTKRKCSVKLHVNVIESGNTSSSRVQNAWKSSIGQCHVSLLRIIKLC